MDARFIKIAARLEIHQRDLKYGESGRQRWLEVVDTVRAVSIWVYELSASDATILQMTYRHPSLACAYGYIVLKSDYPDTEIRAFEQEEDLIMLSGKESAIPVMDKMIVGWGISTDQLIPEDEIERRALEWVR